MIGRRTCGCEGCCDFPVTVTVSSTIVCWNCKNGLSLEFEIGDYFHSIQHAKNDHSWEDIIRRAERLTTDVLKYSPIKNGYKFDWASARIKNRKITLSYTKDGEQILIDLDWDGHTEASVVLSALEFLIDSQKKQVA